MRRTPVADAGEAKPNSTTLGRLFAAIRKRSAKVPGQEWAKVPKDGSHYHDHYLAGVRRK